MIQYVRVCCPGPQHFLEPHLTSIWPRLGFKKYTCVTVQRFLFKVVGQASAKLQQLFGKVVRSASVIWGNFCAHFLQLFLAMGAGWEDDKRAAMTSGLEPFPSRNAGGPT